MEGPPRIKSSEKTSKEEQFERRELIGKGGNSAAYEIKNHPDKILLALGSEFGGENSAEELEAGLNQAKKKIEKYNHVPEGVHAPKILKAWVENGKLLEIMERAKGRPIHDRRGSFETWQDELEILANAPDEHYERFINDARILEETGFIIDPSKPDNFFYDPATGFHFIDLGLSKIESLKVRDSGTYIVPLIYTFNLFSKYRDKISPEVKSAIQRILEKCSKAGIINPESDWWKQGGLEIQNKLNMQPSQPATNLSDQSVESNDVF